MKQQLACLVASSSQESRRINYLCHIAHLYLPFSIQSSSALPSNTLTELAKTHLPTFPPITSDSGDQAVSTQRTSPNPLHECFNPLHLEPNRYRCSEILYSRTGLSLLSLLSIRYLFETTPTTSWRNNGIAPVREQFKGL